MAAILEYSTNISKVTYSPKDAGEDGPCLSLDSLPPNLTHSSRAAEDDERHFKGKFDVSQKRDFHFPLTSKQELFFPLNTKLGRQCVCRYSQKY